MSTQKFVISRMENRGDAIWVESYNRWRIGTKKKARNLVIKQYYPHTSANMFLQNFDHIYTKNYTLSRRWSHFHTQGMSSFHNGIFYPTFLWHFWCFASPLQSLQQVQLCGHPFLFCFNIAKLTRRTRKFPIPLASHYS